MRTEPLKLLTIIAEALLEDRLIHDLEAAGARGWTLSQARGQGSRGVRASEWEGRNVRLETLVAPEVADRLLEILDERYFPHYAVVAFVQDVQVVRGDKYR